MVSKVRFDYKLEARIEDNSARVRHVNSRSKKDGSNIRELFVDMDIFLNKFFTDEKICEWYLSGSLDSEISVKREIYERSQGQRGYSRNDAIKMYRAIFSRVPLDKIDLKRCFDSFQPSEVGL